LSILVFYLKCQSKLITIAYNCFRVYPFFFNRLINPFFPTKCAAPTTTKYVFGVVLIKSSIVFVIFTFLSSTSL